MASTAVFAEILVVGFQAGAWLTLLVLALFGTNWVALSDLEAWAALITVVAVAVAYMLGVIVDRVADDIFLLGARLVRETLPGTRARASGSTADDVGRDVRHKRLVVLDASEGLGKFLDYQRSRLRVARATAVNAVLSIPAATVFLAAQADPTPGLIVFLASAAVVVISASVYAAFKVGHAWSDSLDVAYEVVSARAGREGRLPATR
jgi:hypothetical protein